MTEIRTTTPSTEPTRTLRVALLASGAALSFFTLTACEDEHDSTDPVYYVCEGDMVASTENGFAYRPNLPGVVIGNPIVAEHESGTWVVPTRWGAFNGISYPIPADKNARWYRVNADGNLEDIDVPTFETDCTPVYNGQTDAVEDKIDVAVMIGRGQYPDPNDLEVLKAIARQVRDAPPLDLPPRAA